MAKCRALTGSAVKGLINVWRCVAPGKAKRRWRCWQLVVATGLDSSTPEAECQTGSVGQQWRPSRRTETRCALRHQQLRGGYVSVSVCLVVCPSV